MRTVIKKISITVLGVGLALGGAVAASGDGQNPETRAYLSLSFGGSKIAPRDFHYGLRVDHDSRYAASAQQPILQLDYTTRGLSDLRVNGLSAVRQSYRLHQNDDISEEVVDEPGFFDKVGNWFGGLFGGGGDDSADDGMAEAEEMPVEDMPTDGAFLGYNAIDWGLVAVGAVGLGLAATDIVDSKDNPATSDGGGTDGGNGDGGLPGGLPGGVGGSSLGGLTGGTVGGALFTAVTGDRDRRHDPEYRKWLDGGTGQMGDLGAGH